jgi:hypothetical protein
LILVPRPMPAAPRRYLIVLPMPMPALARSHLIVVPRPSPAAPLDVHRRCLIVAPGRCPRRRSLCVEGTWPWCPGRCRGAAALAQQEKNNSADVLRKKKLPVCSVELSWCT